MKIVGVGGSLRANKLRGMYSETADIRTEANPVILNATKEID